MIADLRLGRWQEQLADLPNGSVRLILTSPPYDNARTYEGTNEPVDFAELARFCLRVLMPGGTLAMVLDAPMKDGEQSITPYRVICEWSALPGWKFRQFLVYGRGGVPGNTRGWFRRDHEPLLVFVRHGAEQVCDKSHLVERRSAKLNRDRAGISRKRDGSRGGGGASKDPEALERVYRGSIWDYGALGNGHDPSCETGHPATFSEAFARDAVPVWSNPGDLVLDPYAGSATVGRACIDLGRRFIGAERVGPCPDCGDPRPGKCPCPRKWRNYYAIGMQRLAQRSIFEA